MTRYAILVHDPDGDSGDGVIVGPFYDVAKAERKAETIRGCRPALYGTTADEVECIVLPIAEGRTSARVVVDRVTS